MIISNIDTLIQRMADGDHIALDGGILIAKSKVGFFDKIGIQVLSWFSDEYADFDSHVTAKKVASFIDGRLDHVKDEQKLVDALETFKKRLTSSSKGVFDGISEKLTRNTDIKIASAYKERLESFYQNVKNKTNELSKEMGQALHLNSLDQEQLNSFDLLIHSLEIQLGAYQKEIEAISEEATGNFSFDAVRMHVLKKAELYQEIGSIKQKIIELNQKRQALLLESFKTSEEMLSAKSEEIQSLLKYEIIEKEEKEELEFLLNNPEIGDEDKEKLTSILNRPNMEASALLEKLKEYEILEKRRNESAKLLLQPEIHHTDELSRQVTKKIDEFLLNFEVFTSEELENLSNTKEASERVNNSLINLHAKNTKLHQLLQLTLLSGNISMKSALPIVKASIDQHLANVHESLMKHHEKQKEIQEQLNFWDQFKPAKPSFSSDDVESSGGSSDIDSDLDGLEDLETVIQKTGLQHLEKQKIAFEDGLVSLQNRVNSAKQPFINSLNQLINVANEGIIFKTYGNFAEVLIDFKNNFEKGIQKPFPTLPKDAKKLEALYDQVQQKFVDVKRAEKALEEKKLDSKYLGIKIEIEALQLLRDLEAKSNPTLLEQQWTAKLRGIIRSDSSSRIDEMKKFMHGFHLTVASEQLKEMQTLMKTLRLNEGTTKEINQYLNIISSVQDNLENPTLLPELPQAPKTTNAVTEARYKHQLAELEKMRTTINSAFRALPRK